MLIPTFAYAGYGELASAVTDVGRTAADLGAAVVDFGVAIVSLGKEVPGVATDAVKSVLSFIPGLG